MAIQGDKIMRLKDGKILYDDLRDRVEEKLDAPEAAGTSGQVLTSDGQGGQAWANPPACDISDVQMNGTSIVSNGVANIPFAGSSTLGVVRASIAQGIIVNPTDGRLAIAPAQSSIIKDPSSDTGAANMRPIVPKFQHESAFYGLAKAAGDSTQSASDNAVGTYTDGAKVAINNMIGSVSKANLENAGITGYTYTTKFGGQFSVTTAATIGYLNPYARASVTGRISKHYMHRVTFNGTEYILPTRLWFEGNKVYEYLGNLGLYVTDISGVSGGTDNVSFVIISDLNNNNSIDVLTSTAGTYTIKVEQIANTQTKLPNSLIYGDNYSPIEISNNSGTYNGFSIGVNELSNTRATFAIGYGSSMQAEFSTSIGNSNIITNVGGSAFGSNNTVSGKYAKALGYDCTASEEHAIALGAGTTASGKYALSEGYQTVSSGNESHAEGYQTEASNQGAHSEGMLTVASGSQGSHAEGTQTVASGSGSHAQNRSTIANGKYMTALGYANIETALYPNWVASTSYSIGNKVNYNNTGYQCKTANSDATFTSSKWDALVSTSPVAVIIGNGATTQARSNAAVIEWNGTAKLAGNVYVGCNSDSTGGTMLPTDVQVNGTSVVSNGVANIPIASYSSFGIIKTDTDLGSSVSSGGYLALSCATTAQVKAGSNSYKPIVPYNQHTAAFYGLAKAAGDSTQSSSSNAVGTYTDSAKSAIQTMLGVEKGVTLVETVSGTTPTIAAQPNVRYNCGTVSTISITPPSAGTCDILFTSGSTAAVLTVPNTVKWPVWFNPSSLVADTIYEIMITDGTYGSVMTWAS